MNVFFVLYVVFLVVLLRSRVQVIRAEKALLGRTLGFIFLTQKKKENCPVV